MSVVTPIDPDTLSFEDRVKMLEEVNLIKEKRCGKINGRTCSYGSKQKIYLKEGYSVSFPTVSLEELFCTLIIDVHEGRNIHTFDVKGTYIHS